MNLLIQHPAVAGGDDIAAGGQRQPEIIVGAVGAHPAADRRMPPVLHIAFLELAGGREQQMFAHQMRSGVDQGHDVLQLIAETKGPSRLVGSASRPKPAGKGLVEKPAVGQDVQGLIGGFDIDRAKGMGPVLPDRIEGGAGGSPAAETIDQSFGIVPVPSRRQA